MERYDNSVKYDSRPEQTFCPHCGKPIEWVQDVYGHDKAVDPVPILFRRTGEGENGITVITALGEIMSGKTVRNPFYAYDFGQRIHYCYMIGRLRR